MKKYSISTLMVLLMNIPLRACPSCNKQLNESIYNGQFYQNLLTTLSSFWIIALVIVLLFSLMIKSDANSITHSKNQTRFPMISSAVILGIGLGGLIDGIVLHQILQWHEMFSNQIPASDYMGKSINMFWDGIFHAFCFIVIITGMIALWKVPIRENTNRSGKLLLGGLLVGWGLFNVIEGIINHHILKLHNVIEFSSNHELGNYAFLGFSFVLIVSGYLIIKNDRNKIKTIFFINHLNF